ncbi:hypothetical protein LN429_15220 [Pseudomonas syringae]|uniref:hypothetical protein n=1 Tax=Pseudomonas syringae TaxID=317 RepID=UPI00234D7034|nr:hypothetical protein [Pseudomonas syringae]MDC6536453.1 hypothetical protein [Pseudomonas syringae]
MHKLTNQIQCGDLAMALEEGLAAIDVELGSVSDLIITPSREPSISSTDLAANLAREFKQALNARAEYEKAQISGDDEEIQNALFEAEICGYNSFRIGSTEPPTLLQSIPALNKAWQTGWDSADFSEELSQCVSCEEGYGDPCPHHG